MSILRLKELLKEKGITGKELSEKVEVTPASISNIVQGNSFPKPELLVKIADTLNIDIRDLFNSTKGAKEPKDAIQEVINRLEDIKGRL